MKKIIIYIITIMCMLVTGCNSDKNNKQSNDYYEYASDPDEEFASDWRSGHENIYGYGRTACDWNRAERFRNYVVQDKWLYYSSENAIYKMPVGGDADEVQLLYNLNFAVSPYEAINIQVIKDWIYFCYGKNADDGGLYRIRTDGKKLTCLLSADQMNVVGGKGFYVAGDEIYYIERERIGVTTSNYYLACLDLGKNAVRRIAEVDEYGSVVAGFENSLFIEGWKGNNKGVRVDFSGSVMAFYDLTYKDPLILYDVLDSGTTGPVFLNKILHIGGTMISLSSTTYEFLVIDSAGQIIDSENPLYSLGDLYVDLENEADIYEGLFPWKDYPRSTYGDSLHGLYYGKWNDENHRINEDVATGIFTGIDGYIYYHIGDWSISDSTGWYRKPARYRVRPDGTGFEDISWMYK